MSDTFSFIVDLKRKSEHCEYDKKLKGSKKEKKLDMKEICTVTTILRPRVIVGVSLPQITLEFDKAYWKRNGLGAVFDGFTLLRVSIMPIHSDDTKKAKDLEDYLLDLESDKKKFSKTKELLIIQEAMEDHPNGCRGLGMFFKYLIEFKKAELREEEERRNLLANANDIDPNIANQVEAMLKETESAKKEYYKEYFDEEIEEQIEEALDKQTQAEVDKQIEELAEKAEAEKSEKNENAETEESIELEPTKKASKKSKKAKRGK